MFKFGFSSEDDETKKQEHEEKSQKLEWISATKIEFCDLEVIQAYNQLDDEQFMEIKCFPGLSLKLIRSERILADLKNDQFQNILEAESQHSDLIPAKYEGGLKIWECSYDLGIYLLEHQNTFTNKRVLDLGCGAGILGILTLNQASAVHFQDYNIEVIKSVTVNNILANVKDSTTALKKCEFYCGDWESLSELLSKEMTPNTKYDLIVTSETIYNPANQRKLYNIFKENLGTGGTGFIAGKTYYFGVGGGMRQFEDLVKEDSVFNIETVWKSKSGLQREILKLTWK